MYYVGDANPTLDAWLTILDFIRDPDDPNFHPVRDVLERNVSTQLRKILFSAIVYGALVTVCLGGVVWGLSYAFQGVLPIHWSSNEPVLEFPVDLLFYNFFMPLAVKYLKPSDGLHAMYNWWFHRCARLLRLSWFLLDERHFDEEGQHIRRTWHDVFRGVSANPLDRYDTDDVAGTLAEHSEVTAFYKIDGRYVRAPASDQVRLPKGSRVFVTVDRDNNRLDGQWDESMGNHGRDSTLFEQVYVPPNFRLRISLFILSIWIFAASTGLCMTIVPLVFGRYLFAILVPSHVRKNDIYAFSIGIYILGSALYLAVHARALVTATVSSARRTLDRTTLDSVLSTIKAVLGRLASVVYMYTTTLLVIPALCALVVEFYLLGPLHTWTTSRGLFSAPSTAVSASGGAHSIHAVQSWTLGLLYFNVLVKVVTKRYRTLRVARAWRLIIRRGWTDPDAALATRALILPVGIFLVAVLVVPLGWAWMGMRIFSLLGRRPFSSSAVGGLSDQVLAYRYAYPTTLFFAGHVLVLHRLAHVLKGWKRQIRDELYLIGERLHNHGEVKKASEAAEVG